MEDRKRRPRRWQLGCVGCCVFPITILLGLTAFGYVKGDLDSVRAHDLVIENDYFNGVSTYEGLMSLPFFSEKTVTEYVEVGPYKYAELNHAMYYVLFKENPRLLVFFYRNGFTQVNNRVRLRDTIFRDAIRLTLTSEVKRQLADSVEILRGSGVEYDFSLMLERMSE